MSGRRAPWTCRPSTPPSTPAGPATPHWSVCPSARSTMAGTVSSALGLVAAAIPRRQPGGDAAGEFTSTSFPFAAQAARGVTVTEVDSDELVTTASDYDVVTVSLVQSASGAVLDAEALRANVAGTDTLTVIDVTQALGWKNIGLAVGRRHRGRRLQVADGAARHGVDVAERPRLALDGPARRQLVRGRSSRGRRSTGCRCGWPRMRDGSTCRRPGSAHWAPG